MPGVQHRIDRDLEALKPMSIQAGSKDPQLWLTPEETNQCGSIVGSTRYSAIAVDCDTAARRTVLV